MQRKVEYYNGREITKDALRRVNLIDLKRIEEGITQFSMEEVKSLKDLSCSHKTKYLKHEHLILGEDWYVFYVNMPKGDIEIKDWVAINNVENKFAQTMEMFNELKKVLLKYKDSYINAMLRHSTSYPFYKKFLEEGYLEEMIDIIDFDDYLPRLEEIKEEILDEYDGVEEYLLDPNRKIYEEEHVDDYIYHEVSFSVSEKFKNKYKKSGR